jgi:hypothetical protein
MDMQQAQRIVGAYGDTLLEQAATGVVRDAKSLPFSKTEIKAALKFAINVTSDGQMREQLKVGYISLADFQELSDLDIQRLQQWGALLSKNSTMSNEELGTAAKVMAEIGRDVTAIQSRVASEAQVLMKELETAGLR